jgi:transcriptional regulator with XRE-family HTH domain
MENQPSSKYKYLATKLKECREKATPRLKQQELADLMTASGVTVKRTTITNWETGYADPSEEAILIYAKLRGDNYWWWLCYLLDEDAKPGLTVDYNNLGQKTLQEPDWNEADIEDMQEQWEIEHLAEKELTTPPKKGVLAQALKLKAPDAVEAIRRMLKQPQPYSAPIKVLYYDDEGKQITDEKYLHEKQVTKNPDDTRTAQPEGGLAVVGRLAAQKNDQAWEALSSSFFQTVQHQITKKLPGAHSHFKKDIWSGSLKSRADFFDGEYVVEFVVAKSSILTLKLSEGLGKLCLIDKMLPKSKPKMLVVCTNIDRPQTNPKLLDDQSTARAMGIELLFVSHFDEVMAAEAVIAFISRPNTQD